MDSSELSQGKTIQKQNLLFNTLFYLFLDDGKKVIRLHVKGLPAKISEKDVEDRFKSFGQIHSVELIPHPFEGINYIFFQSFSNYIFHY